MPLVYPLDKTIGKIYAVYHEGILRVSSSLGCVCGRGAIFAPVSRLFLVITRYQNRCRRLYRTYLLAGTGTLEEVLLMPSVVVTGVSSGIGWGASKVLLQHGFEVFGSVRKQEDADRLSAEWGNAFTPLLFDITDEPAVRKAAAVVESHL